MARSALNKPNKMEFIQFTAELHSFLISEGYTVITTFFYIPDKEECFKNSNGIDGYAIIPSRPITFEDGRRVDDPMDNIMVQKNVRVPKDPNDPTREELLKQINPIIEELMRMFVPDLGLPYRDIYWWENATEDVKVTDSMVQFPIRSERVKEMYGADAKDKFYLLLDRSMSNEIRMLWRKIKSGMAVKSKSRNLRKI